MLEEEDLRLRMRGKFFIFCSSPVEDSMTADIVVDVGNGEPSFWIWVTKEMVPSMVHEPCSIDNESYVIINEDQVVDDIGYFMARCILANPNSKV